MTMKYQAHQVLQVCCLSQNLRAWIPNKLVPLVSSTFSLASNTLKMALLWSKKHVYLWSASHARTYRLPDINFAFLRQAVRNMALINVCSPQSVHPCFIFSPSTATVVLRKHLHELHPEEYKSAGFLDHPVYLAVADEEVSPWRQSI